MVPVRAAVPVKDTIKVVSPEGFAVDTPDKKYAVADSDTAGIPQ